MATGTTKPRLSPGEVVGRYRIDGIVGKGGFGAVYRATQIDTGAAVALKILLKNFSSSKTDSKRFKREASLVQKLRHRNVVELLDFGYTDRQQPFIAFELLEGESLSEMLKNGGALPVWRAGAIAVDVLEALEAAHAFGVIHRDIKPGNVFLLRGAAGAKVLDFGIAKVVSGDEAVATQLTEAGQMIGTPHYMAPEQVRGTGVVPATDLYALGLVTAEMISGQRVVTGQALIDVYMTHIQDEPLDFPPVVRSSPLWPVIDRATQKALEQRYASATEMLQALRPIVASLAGAASAGTARSRLEPLSELNETYRMQLEPAKRDHLAALTADQALGNGTVLMSSPSAQAQSAALAGAMLAAPPSHRMPHTTTPMPHASDAGAPPSLGPASLGPASLGPASLGPASLGPASITQVRATPAPHRPSDPLEATVDMSNDELQSYMARLATPAAPTAPRPSRTSVVPAPPPRRAPKKRPWGAIIAVLGVISIALVVAVLLVLRPF